MDSNQTTAQSHAHSFSTLVTTTNTCQIFFSNRVNTLHSNPPKQAYWRSRSPSPSKPKNSRYVMWSGLELVDKKDGRDDTTLLGHPTCMHAGSQIHFCSHTHLAAANQSNHRLQCGFELEGSCLDICHLISSYPCFDCTTQRENGQLLLPHSS